MSESIEIPSVFEQRIRVRIAELEAEIPQIVQQANAAIAARQGAIAELKKLLEPDNGKETSNDHRLGQVAQGDNKGN